MFTRTDVATIARKAAQAEEGKGQGHTVYAQGITPKRYVVGGYAPAQLYPVGAATAHMRVRIWDAVHAPAAEGAHTLGYWEDEGTVYVDLGDTWDGLGTAIAVAQARGELAIYDRREGRVITLGNL